MLSLFLLGAAGCAFALPRPESAANPGRVAFAGMNIAGFDFGCTQDGSCDTGGNVDVVTQSDGVAQINHFVTNDGMNAFRLPVGWQFLVNNVLGGPLDPTNFAKYDQLVQGCVASGAQMCIVDIHNYARYNGKIIGQDPSGEGPTNEQYTSLLSQLATKYNNVSQVAFDIMNEPHDMPDLVAWAATAQAAVTAIRNAGATSQVILLPGTDFASAGSLPTRSGPSLLTVKNPDGTTKNLIFNVHQYLDADSSGTNAECARNNIEGSFQPLAAWLRTNGRAAMVTETGGGPNAESCMQYMCEQMDFLNANSDVFKGVITWAAGGFTTKYVITQTPFPLGDGAFQDQPLVTQCVVNKFRNPSGLL